jgi:hypothetical protein
MADPRPADRVATHHELHPLRILLVLLRVREGATVSICRRIIIEPTAASLFVGAMERGR